MSDVSGSAGGQGDGIDLRVEISFSGLDPPEGLVVVRGAQRSDRPMREPEVFVGWLGLFGVLHWMTVEQLDQPPSSG